MLKKSIQKMVSSAKIRYTVIVLFCFNLFLFYTFKYQDLHTAPLLIMSLQHLIRFYEPTIILYFSSLFTKYFAKLNGVYLTLQYSKTLNGSFNQWLNMLLQRRTCTWCNTLIYYFTHAVTHTFKSALNSKLFCNKGFYIN